MAHGTREDLALEVDAGLLVRGYEPEVGRSLAELFAQEGIQVLRNAKAQAVRQDGPDIVTTAVVAGRERQYRTERLLIATDRRPNTGSLRHRSLSAVRRPLL